MSVRRRSAEEMKKKRRKEKRKKERRGKKRHKSGSAGRRRTHALHLQEVKAWRGTDEMAAQDWLERFEQHAKVYDFSGDNCIHAMGMKLEEEQARQWHAHEVTRLDDMGIWDEDSRWVLYKKSFVEEFVNRSDVRAHVWARWGRIRR